MLTTDFILSLYDKYKNSILEVRTNMKKNHPHGEPQYDDVEAEITALLIFHFKPTNVVEFSPCTGWSTSIILNALSINNNNSMLTSYDIVDRCTTFVNNLKYNTAKWQFYLGDVTKQFENWDLDKIDYLFIDSDHSSEFAVTFINKLLIPLLEKCKANNKKVIVSVHDVFHGRPNEPLEEGYEVINFLNKNNICFYNASKCLVNNFNLINNHRKSIGLNEQIHVGQANPSIFFILE